MKILGVSAHRPDSAAAVVVDGRIVAAAQEERFSRRKNEDRFPRAAIAACLEQAGLGAGDLDAVAFADPERAAAPPWPGDLPPPRLVDRLHALAAAAFLPSPFAEAAVVVQDECGFGRQTGLAAGRDGTVALRRELPAPHGIGPLYSAATRLAGFRVGTGEFKLMGLAPFGRPRFRAAIEAAALRWQDDGTLLLDAAVFPDSDPESGAARLAALLGIPFGDGGGPAEAHMDLAASVQAVADEALSRLADGWMAATGAPALCLGGRFALNCAANGRLLARRPGIRLWVQPAAGTAGAALGAALAVAAAEHAWPIVPADRMAGARLGPAFARQEVATRLTARGARFDIVEPPALIARVAEALAAGLVVGWMQGRMEFGPRALGGRSILADPRGAGVQRLLNVAVKRREPFRPFAPVVPAAEAGSWFGCDRPSPYMTLTFPVLPAARERLPAITHVDGSARLQTVAPDDDPRLSALLAAFAERTGCPVLVNTSFNVRGEPLVNTPEDAFRCFMGSDIDVLAIENCLLRKADQDPSLAGDHAAGFSD